MPRANPNRSTVNRRIGNRYVRFDCDNDIPLRSSHLGQYPNLLHFEPFRDGAMQVDGHFSYLWQLDRVAGDGIILELRKYKGLELARLFETRESMSPFLKCFPGIMQSANRSLQHLRMDFAQMRELLLRFGQVVLLTVVRQKRFIGRNDVFLLQ